MEAWQKLGDVIATVQDKIGAAAGAQGSAPGGSTATKPNTKSKQGQNPGKSKSLAK